MMNKLSPRLLCQIYALLVLLAAALMSALPYCLLALALLAAILVITVRPLPPRTKVAITMATIFLLPLAGAATLTPLTLPSPILTQMVAALATLPLIYLLDDNLRQSAQQSSQFMPGRKGRHTTQTYVALFTTTLGVIVISLALSQPVLLFTGIILALYLLAMLAQILLTIPRQPIAAPATLKRVIAGTTADVPFNIISKVPRTIHCLITPPEPRVALSPQRFTMSQGESRLNLSVTPTLAGPSRPLLQVSITDSRGLVQINQTIEPLELEVIPRAKYAEWLASKFLEQTGTGVVATAALPSEAMTIHKKGTEYWESRSYQAGDQLRDIDWKHTLKLSQLIVKEYIAAGEKATIIAVNLSVSGAEEADILAFNLITAALTLAREKIPAALAAYNHQRVVLTTAVSDPTQILRQAMSLVKEITSVELARRHLEPPHLTRLRRNITQLRKAESESAQHLLDLLDFEYRAIETAAKNHPATIALSSVAEHTPAPAMIVLISPLNHDAEAVMITTEKLAKREFATIPLPLNQS